MYDLVFCLGLKAAFAPCCYGDFLFCRAMQGAENNHDYMRMRQRSHRVGEGDNIWLDGLVWSRPQNEDLLLVCKPIKDPMILSLHVSDVADTSVSSLRLQEAHF